MSVDADLLKVLSDPLRLRIVSLLASETLCTTHLVAETGASQTNLSNHLRMLREAGVVETEPCGRFTYYRLCPEVLDGASRQLAALAETARTAGAAQNKRAC